METISVSFNGEDVSFALNTKDFKFVDLDGWVRSRFGIKTTDKLRYMDKLGAECIPSKDTILESKRVYVKQVEAAKAVSHKSFNWFPYPFFCITLTLLLVGLYAESFGFEIISTVKTFSAGADKLLFEAGIIHKPGVVIEAIMAVICWSSTYLFIRRLWNPETTNSTVERFSPDSFFGGLAAGFSIILKSALIKALRV